MRARLANRLWLASARPEAGRFEAAMSTPESAQLRLLKDYIRSAVDSPFGREHGLARVNGLDTFRRRVPIRGYDELAGWIERVRKGETRVLGHAPVRSFVPSSGSTAARKLIPYTSVLLGEFKRALQAWIGDLFRSRPDLMGGPAYWALSPAMRPPELPGSRVPCRFEHDGAYLGRLAEPLVRAMLVMPASVRRIEDAESFRYVTLLYLLRQRELRLISVWHPSFLTLLLEDLRDRWGDLLTDVARGGIHSDVTLGGSIRESLVRRLPPNARRAHELEAADPERLRDAWPKLGLISCWADGHAWSAVESLRRQSSGVPIQPKGLLATEAVVSVPFRGAWPLAVRSHFCEFLDDDGRPWLAHELRRGGEYEVVVSTGSGLLRYRLGDRIRVDGFVGATPSVRFGSRADRVSDYRGEKLSDGHVAAVLERLLGERASEVAFAMLAPDLVDGRCGYTLYLECRTEPPVDLADRLDRELSANPHYGYCRRLGQLEGPRIFRVTGAAQRAYVAGCQRAGQGLGEIKPAALSLRADWTERFEGRYVEARRRRTG